MKTLIVLVLVSATAMASPKVTLVPCDKATAFEKKLSLANGLSVDLSDPKVKAAQLAAAKELEGKTFGFKGCKFRSQGNDVVSFSSAKGESIACRMQDGERDVDKFRDAAMAIKTSDLKLDVTGTVAMSKDPNWRKLEMSSCSVAAHN